MIHGVYVKSKPKAKWHLVSMSTSAEGAVLDRLEILKQAKLLGNEEAEAVIQVYESSFYIPEFITHVKEQKILYN